MVSRRIIQLNLALHRDIARYISRSVNVEGILITVSYVSIKEDLQSADVGVVCIPSNEIIINKIVLLLNSHVYKFRKVYYPIFT